MEKLTVPYCTIFADYTARSRCYGRGFQGHESALKTVLELKREIGTNRARRFYELPGRLRVGLFRWNVKEFKIP